MGLLGDDLDATLDDLASIDEVGFGVVTLVVNGRSCRALFDDGDQILQDAVGRPVQDTELVLRYRDGAITDPAIDAAVTVKQAGQSTRTMQVHRVLVDPQFPGFKKLLVGET